MSTFTDRCGDRPAEVFGGRPLALLHDLVLRAGDAPTVSEAARLVTATLAADARELPFALLYLLDAAGRATLACSAGIEPGHPVEQAASWPIAEVIGARAPRDVTGVGAKLPASLAARGRPPTTAVVLPLRAPGQREPTGALVVGLDPDRPLDDGYRAFLDLVAREIGASLTAARAREERDGAARGAEALRWTVDDRELSRMQEVFTRAPFPVAVTVGPDHRFEFVNPSFVRMVDRTELVGRTVREVFPELSEHESIATLDEVYRTGRDVRRSELYVPLSRYRREQPGEGWFDYTIQPLHDDAGAVSGLMIVATEVTEQVLARRSTDSLRQAAERANRAKDEFLAMLGHELRNPLSPIVTALQLMRLRSGDSSVERERKVIERQVDHLVRLVDDLLDMSRITRGKLQLKKEPIEISAVVANAIDVASPLLEQHRHHLHVDVPPQGLVVEGDVTRLSQVITNLLTNAAKYTPPGGHVNVSAALKDSSVVVRVRDDGMGIAPDMLPYVFDLFVQEPQALDRASGGLGLGLSIVRSIVELHGGRVAVHSAGRGRGSEFVVELPAGEEERRTPEAPAQQTLPLARPREGALRVLVVDDNEDAAEMLCEWIAMDGYDTRTAHDGLAALQEVERYVPDVILLDIGLPVMDGYEVARKLRDRGVLDRTVVVALTGYGQPLDRARSAAAGFHAHLVKPVDLDALGKLLAGCAADARKKASGRPADPRAAKA